MSELVRILANGSCIILDLIDEIWGKIFGGALKTHRLKAYTPLFVVEIRECAQAI